MVKNQHYIPRFYLKNFAASDSMLSVIRIENGKPGSVFRCKPDGICSEKYLHEVKSRSESTYFQEGAIEDMLSQVESRLAPKYEELLGCLDDGELIGTARLVELIDCLIAFIASLVVRHPKWLGPERKKASTLIPFLFEKETLTVSDLETLEVMGLKDDLPAIVEMAIMDAALFSTDERAPLMQIVDILKPMNVKFFAAPDNCEFIATSFLLHAEWMSTSDADPVAVYFPLSSQFAVAFRSCEPTGGKLVWPLIAEQVDSLNRCLVGGSDLNDLVFGTNGSYLASIISATAQHGNQ